MRVISDTFFYSPPHHIKGPTITITGSEARHAVKVLRSQEGDRLTVVDGCGHEYDVSIERIDGNLVEGKIIGRRSRTGEPGHRVTLAQAFCRGSKFDWIVEKATELGVGAILPFLAERSPQAPHQGHLERRIERWRHIAIAAMKQSRRSVLPHIAPVSSYDAILSSGLVYDVCLIACERERERGVGDVLPRAGTNLKILVVVGPEGGFSETERHRAAEARFQPFSLGQRRLRTETAGPLSIALVLYQLGELGGARGNRPVEGIAGGQGDAAAV